ncbi:MAG TPA: outer membrane beta-barrel protein [Cyclobacteriaceae bacterium]|nr:outer membrane beta-barrel protein [Cyclobacteriaceae bacterium]
MLNRSAIVFALVILQFNLFAQETDENAKLDSAINLLDTLSIIVPDTIKGSVSTEKSRKKITIDWHNLPYIFDDMSIIAGVSRSGLHYTANYRELSHIGGWTLGVEDFVPVFERAFLHFGVKYARRGFEHSRHDIKFITHNIDMPLFLSYELPAMRLYDFRLFFGAQTSIRTGSNRQGNYGVPLPGETFYTYIPSQFNRFDFGFTFGLSAEVKDFYIRMRAFSGYFKLMPDDTGMNSAFSLEVGYFVFRNLRR